MKNKYDSKQEAIEKAKVLSIENNKVYYIILADGIFFIDIDSFLRIHEQIICTVENGEVYYSK